MLEQMLFMNNLVAWGVLVLEIILAALVLDLVGNGGKFAQQIFHLKRVFWKKTFLSSFFETPQKGLLFIVFFFSFASSTLTLVYSEIFGVIPCALCWFERVFMYGIVLISGTAFLTGDEFEHKNIFKYILTFSVAGLFISLYHHILQMTASLGSSLPCPASSGDCTKITIFEFGHITFPWMAFILFALFIYNYFFLNKVTK